MIWVFLVSLLLQPFPEDCPEDPCWVEEVVVVVEDPVYQQINQEFQEMEQAFDEMEMLLDEGADFDDDEED